MTAGRDPTLAARLARGIFAKPGCYPATVRFANSDPQVNSDQKADVRSLSFCVDLAGGGAEVPANGVRRQDFSLQNAPTLPINDARAFLATMKVLTARKPGQRLGVADVPGPVARCARNRVGKSAVYATAESVSAASLLEHGPVPPWCGGCGEAVCDSVTRERRAAAATRRSGRLAA